MLNAFLLIWDLKNRAKREGMFDCVLAVVSHDMKRFSRYARWAC